MSHHTLPTCTLLHVTLLMAASILMGTSALSFDTIRSYEPIEAASVITAEIESKMHGRINEASTHYCTISEDEPCDLNGMERDTSTVVYPGGDTRCITEETTPYAFQVIPGDYDKVLFYFDGGGACWDKISTDLSFCTMGIEPSGPWGVFDRTNQENPFLNYTIVQALYCSGDAFVANNQTQPWTTPYGDSAVQTGQQNVVATIHWLQTQLQSVGTLSNLTSFVVSGQSAGALGAQAYSGPLLRLFPAIEQQVIPDSYLAVFPVGSQGSILKNTWPVCDGGFLASYMSADISDKCHAGQLTVQDWLLDVMPAYPEVPFSFIQAKYDAVQISFYVAIAASFRMDPVMTPKLFYSLSNDILLRYEDVPNEVHFLVDSSQHTYTDLSIFYSAGTTGSSGGPRGETAGELRDWTAATIGNPSNTSTQCSGKLIFPSQWDATEPFSYCDPTMAGKVFPDTSST